MMTDCEAVLRSLDDYLDGGLPAPELARLEAHLAECPDCRRRQRAAVELQQALRGLREEELPPQLAGRLLTQARRAQPPRRQPWLAGALAASLALGVAIGVWWPAGMPETIGVDTAATDIQTVTVRVRSSQALDDARLTLQLPENMEIAGYPGQRELSWRTSLRAGDNWLELPLRVRGGSPDGVRMQVASGDGEILSEHVVFEGGAAWTAPYREVEPRA